MYMYIKTVNTNGERKRYKVELNQPTDTVKMMSLAYFFNRNEEEKKYWMAQTERFLDIMLGIDVADIVEIHRYKDEEIDITVEGLLI